MDFLDPQKKRSHKIRLYIGYALMAVGIALATLILVFSAYGYDIDRDTGGVIQNGLIVIGAQPESATIKINGVDKGTTNDRLVLPAAKYSIELARDGYMSWKHDVNLEGSTIEQLVYPFMFPEKLTTKTLQQYSAVPTMSSTSPDRKWLVVSLPEATGSFQVVDLGNDKHPVTTVALPADTMTSPAGARNFEAVEWSTDNNHLLLKHTFTGGVEFIVLNREKPAESVNLNKIFATQAFTSISLRDKKPDQFFMHNATDGSLYTADSKTKLVALLRTNVLAYKSYEADTVLYVTSSPKDATVEARVSQKGQDHAVRDLPKSDVYMLDMAKFNGKFYLVCGSTADSRTYVYRDPFDALNSKPERKPQPLRVLITPKAEFVSFSAIARFIAVQGGSGFAIYDAETGRQYRYDTKLPIEPRQKATWMDGHRLLLTSQNKVNVFDFDGTNMHALSGSLGSFVPSFDRDYTALFTIVPASDNPTQTTLTRTELKVLPPAGQ